MDEEKINLTNDTDDSTTNLFSTELDKVLEAFEPVEGGTLSPATSNYEDCYVSDHIMEVLNFKKDSVDLLKLIKGGYKLDTQEV